MKLFACKKGLCLASLVLLCGYSSAQTSVTLAPIPLFQSFLQSGRPNAFGCVFTYQSNTNNNLDTYTDATGNTKNGNPVDLSAGGMANIWIKTGQAYGFTIRASGGSHCSSGSIVASIQGIGGGASILTTAVAFSSTPTFTDQSQNQLFTITLTGNATALPLSVVGVTPPGYITFQITQDNVGAHTFTWPPNMVGGAPIGLTANQITTQEFLWNGTTAIALGPAVTGSGPALSSGAIAANGNLAVTGNISATGNLSAVGTVTGGSFPSPVITTPTVNAVPIPYSPGTYISLLNEAVTGTTLNTLTKITGAPSTAITIAATDKLGIVGITVAGNGLTGNATIQQSGIAPCVFVGATTAGDYVQPSISTPTGRCADVGSTYPQIGQVIGRVLSTNAGAGTFNIDLLAQQTNPAPLIGGGTAITVLAFGGGALTAGTGNFDMAGSMSVVVACYVTDTTDPTKGARISVVAGTVITVVGNANDTVSATCFGR